MFAALSASAVRTKSATFDEPLDLFAAWSHRFAGDYTVNPEHPPLWTLWASLALEPGSIVSPPREAFPKLDQAGQARTVFTALYRTPGVDADRLIQRARLLMLVPAVLLGVLLAIWAWELGGPVAGVLACAFYALDPAFLGHSPLIKNDTMAAVIPFAIAYATWRLGRRATFWNVAAAALLCGASLVVKFTDLPCLPIAAGLLIARAALPVDWLVLGRSFDTFGRRLRVAGLLIMAFAVVSVAVTWSVYRFRYEPSPDRTVAFDTSQFLEDLRTREAAVHDASVADWQPPVFAAALLRAMQWHLMPDAWLHGLLFMRSHSLLRESYLLGSVRMLGVWYYFPFALLVKMPLGTIAAALTAGALAIALRGKRDTWTWRAVCVPALGFLIPALVSSLNIGIRHALPVLPFLFLGIGVAGAEAIRRWRTPAIVAAAVLVAATAGETLRAYPGYIAFFNAAAGGVDGGINLLGDSNLDWGQDLPLLAEWQKSHVDRPLYIAYFGFADPVVYGVRYRMMPGDYIHQRPADPLERPAYAAISVTNLQGIYATGKAQALFRSFLSRKPIARLGGTIYVYELATGDN
jgi:hypothetical protein